MVPPPHSSSPGLGSSLRNKDKSEGPLSSNGKPLPVPRDMIIDIPSSEFEPQTDEDKQLALSSQAFLLKQLIGNIYPELAGQEITVKNGKVLLGARRVGSLTRGGGGPERIRIWVDEILTQKQKQEYSSREEFPRDPKELGTILPLSEIFSLVRTADCNTLMAAVSRMKYASLITDGYVARLEFHSKKRGTPAESFLLKLNF